MRVPPPLDTHAHIAADISTRDLQVLGAHLFAMTRSLAEFEAVRGRSDRRAIWGVGTHPGLVGAQKAFRSELFESAVRHTPLVGEVGLDGGSRVPLALQTSTLRSVLEVLQQTPRLISVHSAGAQLEVLRLLHQVPVSGVILHWWTGSSELTEEAVRLGCYFSVPPALMSSVELLRAIPSDRLLPETDHPFGDRRTSPPRRPGGVSEVEANLAAHLGASQPDVRRLLWRNLSTVIADTDTADLFPLAWKDIFSRNIG